MKNKELWKPAHIRKNKEGRFIASHMVRYVMHIGGHGRPAGKIYRLLMLRRPEDGTTSER
jgi:hypothetical protein